MSSVVTKQPDEEFDNGAGAGKAALVAVADDPDLADRKAAARFMFPEPGVGLAIPRGRSVKLAPAAAAASSAVSASPDQRRAACARADARLKPAGLRQMGPVLAIGDERVALLPPQRRKPIPRPAERRVQSPSPPLDGRAKRSARSASRRVMLRLRASATSSRPSPRIGGQKARMRGTISRLARIGTAVNRTVPSAGPASCPTASPICRIAASARSAIGHTAHGCQAQDAVIAAAKKRCNGKPLPV